MLLEEEINECIRDLVQFLKQPLSQLERTKVSNVLTGDVRNRTVLKNLLINIV